MFDLLCIILLYICHTDRLNGTTSTLCDCVISCLRAVYFFSSAIHTHIALNNQDKPINSSSNKKNEAIFWRVTTHTRSERVNNGFSNMDDSIINIDDESDSFSWVFLAISIKLQGEKSGQFFFNLIIISKSINKKEITLSQKFI